jgi:hypothetical protein
MSPRYPFAGFFLSLRELLLNTNAKIIFFFEKMDKK